MTVIAKLFESPAAFYRHRKRTIPPAAAPMLPRILRGKAHTSKVE